MTITDGVLVSIEYTVSDDTGEKIESNVGEEALEFVQGDGQMIPGVEKALEGMHAGDSKDVQVVPEDAYGAVDPELIVEVPKEKIPEEAHAIGTELQTVDPEGEVLMGIVAEVHDESLVLDFNHPLAGENLNFEIKILDVSVPEALQN